MVRKLKGYSPIVGHSRELYKYPKGFYLNLKVEDKIVSALLDTGASVSVIDEDLVNKSSYLREKVNHGKSLPPLTGVGGSKINVVGTVNCVFMLANFSFKPHLMRVIPEKPSVSVILGMDFLSRNNMVIDVANNKVQIRGDSGELLDIPVTIETHGEGSCLRVAEDTLLQPNQRQIVKLTCNAEDRREGIIEPIFVKGGAWRVANSLNIVVDGFVYGQILNVSSSPIKLMAKSQVGNWYPTCNILNVIDEDRDHRSVLFEELHLEGLDITAEQRSLLEGVLGQYCDVFGKDEDDLGYCSAVKHDIDTGNHPPIRQRYRRLQPPLKDQVQEELDRMEKHGIIQKSCSPWCSPLVPVKKKSGKIRICIDYRKLNSITKLNSYPLPNIEDTLMQFSNTKFFSTLDLLSGYHQIALDRTSMEKTAFSTDRGLYEYKVMPQGACNSPATFQNLMNVMLQGMASHQASAYLDDILITGRTFEEHLENLEEVLKRLRSYGLKLSTQKCNLLKDSVPYLGHILTRDGVKTSDKNVEAIMNLPIPTTVRGLKKLNGMISYYSKFIPNIAVLMEPLYKITSQKKLYWTSECSEALEKIKSILSSDPVLAYPRYGEEDTFIVTTDASDVGLGAVLSQCQEGEERIIGYGSVSLNKAQKKYSTTDKELAALRFGVKHFKPYIYGRKFIVRTDHKALIYLNQMKNVDPRLMRTYEDLQVGDYEVEYIKGQENVLADHLSRNPLSVTSEMGEAYESPEYDSDPVFTPPGGPNTLFESLSHGMTDSIPPLQLKRELSQYLLGNLKSYGVEGKSKNKKWITSYGEADIFSGMDLLPVFVDVFLCDVIVYHKPGPRLTFRNKESRSDIILESRGGIHFNLLREETVKDNLDSPLECSVDHTEKLHVIRDDENDSMLGSGLVDLPEKVRIISTSTSDGEGTLSPIDSENHQSSDSRQNLPYCDGDSSSCDELTEDEAMLVVQQVHEDLHHPGVAKTLHTCKKKIKTRINRLAKIVKKCIKECSICQRFKPLKQSKEQAAPMYNLKPSRTGEVIALDLLDLGQRTSRGNKVLLVGIDLYSKFGYAVPLRSKTSAAVAKALENGIFSNVVHIPKSILTDNGPEFRGTAFREILNRYRVEHKCSIPYHPRSNGAVERLNRTLKERLATTLDGDYRGWDGVIVNVMVQYNRTIHSETGRSPVSFYSNFADDPILRKPKEFRTNPGRNFKPYSVGDLVLRKIPFKTGENRHKLSPIFDGPYKIVEKLSDVSYRLGQVDRKGRHYLVHVSQLRPYHHTPGKTRVFSNKKRRNTVRPPDTVGTWQVPAIPVDPVINIDKSIRSAFQAVGESCLDGLLGGYVSDEYIVDGRARLISTPECDEPPPLNPAFSRETIVNRTDGDNIEELSRDFEDSLAAQTNEDVLGDENRLDVSSSRWLQDDVGSREESLNREVGGLSTNGDGIGQESYVGMITRSRARRQREMLKNESSAEQVAVEDAVIIGTGIGHDMESQGHREILNNVRGHCSGDEEDVREGDEGEICEGENGGVGEFDVGTLNDSFGVWLEDDRIFEEQLPKIAKCKTHTMRLRSDTRADLLESQNRQGVSNRDMFSLTGLYNADGSTESLNILKSNKGKPLESTAKSADGGCKRQIDHTRHELVRDIVSIVDFNRSLISSGRRLVEPGDTQGKKLQLRSEGFEGVQDIRELQQKREDAFRRLNATIKACRESVEKVMDDGVLEDDSSLGETLRDSLLEAEESLREVREMESILSISLSGQSKQSGVNIEDWDLTSEDFNHDEEREFEEIPLQMLEMNRGVTHECGDTNDSNSKGKRDCCRVS